MRTYQFEGVMTALSSISHNGGQSFGINSKLRREKFVQPDGSVEDVPVISGNGIRGLLRDRGMMHMCQSLGYGVDKDGAVKGLPLPAFHFLFSGGALTEGGKGMDIDYARKLRSAIPLVGVFGGAIGGMILPGRIQIGKAIPVCRETRHLLPERFVDHGGAASVWDFLQEEFYTRKDDSKNWHLNRILPLADRPRAPVAELPFDSSEVAAPAAPVATKDSAPQQMMYYVETFASGTPFYWRVTIEDATDLEFEAFVTCLTVWSQRPTLGGKANVGHGQVRLSFDRWLEIDSRFTPTEGSELQRPIGSLYAQHLEKQGEAIRSLLQEMK